MAANQYRGEVDLDFAGKTMTMRATLDCMVRIEALCGVGCIELALRYHKGLYSFGDTINIITEGLRAGSEGDQVNVKAVGQQVLMDGIVNFHEPVTRFLAMALGGETDEDDPTKQSPRPRKSRTKNS